MGTEKQDLKHLEKKNHKVSMAGNLYSMTKPKNSSENSYKGSETYATVGDGVGTVYNGADMAHMNSGYIASDEEDFAVRAHEKFTDLEGKLIPQ